MDTSITLCDGKYKFIEKDGYSLSCQRYGDMWRSFVGDKAVGALYGYAIELRTENDKLKVRIAQLEQLLTTPEKGE